MVVAEKVAELTEEEIEGDSLDQYMDRESILLAGGQGSGKSKGAVELVAEGMENEFNVVVIDFDKGFAKEVKTQLGKQPDNLEYFLAKNWSRVQDGINFAFKNLGVGDWLVFEMMNSMWELAQSQYVDDVYGGNVGDMLRMLRADAETEILALQGAGKLVKDKKDADPKKGKRTAASVQQQSVSYGGLKGRTDWFPIKAMHNKDVRERAIMRGDFHLLGTTALQALQQEEAQSWPEWTNLSRRPSGEKNNVYKFDTIIVAECKGGKYLWRTDMGNGKGKDRGGRELVKDMDVTGISLIADYLDFHGLEL